MAIKGELKTRVSRAPPYASKRLAVRGRKVWLSGGARGLGLSMAEALVARGCAAVAVADVADEAAGAAAVAHLLARRATPAQQVRYVRTDVREPAQVAASMREAARAFGGLDTVVNNAGVADEREIDLTLDVNLKAVIRATEAALHAFAEVGGDGERVIVNVASAGGVFEMPIAPIYSASKFGVVGYTKSMRNACWERGVRIHCLCPGWADVGMGETVSTEGSTAKYTGILEGAEVADCLIEVLRRRDLVGEAVYVSKVTGARIVAQDISRRMDAPRRAKM